ncbi:Stomatal closure-related actin-binding protein [Vigna unguiculata]|uniref:Stomatal closure-related actin-binding protein n=1 Tax=Vigna unguiculata TaxID=3917 RepID=A0A4D6LCI7_VIGUN|nr:Stomatal closure-related actin-binding protein [Vigna unguiculata]
MDLLQLYLELNVGITLIPHCMSSHLYLTTCRLSYDPFTPTPLKLTKTTRNRPTSLFININDDFSLYKNKENCLNNFPMIHPSFLTRTKKGGENIPHLYELKGNETLGSYLQIQPCSDNAPEVSKCSIQWYRVSSDGATKSVYASEPFDVGRVLQADVISESEHLTLSTVGPIDPAVGFGTYVEALVHKHDTEFNVFVTQMNGSHPTESVHVLHVGKIRIKLCKGKTTIAKEYYSSSMQLCGVRGGGNAAAQGVFWQPKQGHSFVLAFKSERERNVAIMLARRFAFDCNICPSETQHIDQMTKLIWGHHESPYNFFPTL